jgi:hypothetical protein
MRRDRLLGDNLPIFVDKTYFTIKNTESVSRGEPACEESARIEKHQFVEVLVLENHEYKKQLEIVGRMRDRLGMPVDQKIRSVVAILRCFGFYTNGSCAGHMSRATGGPYITLSSVEGENLQEKWIKLEPGSPEHTAMHKEIVKVNLAERYRLERLLASFYDSRHVAYDQMIIITSYGPGATRLKCSGIDIREIAPAKEKRSALKRYQDEFQLFAEYLMERYFIGK